LIYDCYLDMILNHSSNPTQHTIEEAANIDLRGQLLASISENGSGSITRIHMLGGAGKRVSFYKRMAEDE